MSISTISFNNASRAQIMRVQADLRDALVESTTNRHADVGRTLGRATADAVSFRAQETSLERMLQSNTLVTQRLELMDDTLARVQKRAEAVRDQLIPSLSDPAFFSSAKQVTAAAMEEFVGALNLSVGGQYLFSGTQTDIRPLTPYASGPGEAVRDHFAQFLSVAGRTEATVTADEVAAYFGGGFTAQARDPAGVPLTDANGAPVTTTIAFDDLFEDPSWNETFSNASDTPIQSRIGKTETISSSVSANMEVFRDLMAGFAAMELASEAMDPSARQAIGNAARAKVANGVAGLTALQSDLGNRMARVSAANASITQQKDIFKAHVASLEEVDLVEASQRVAALQTQLEASYRVTGMIREINILDYL